MSLEKLKNKKIIFFGDSITDSNRRLNPKYPMGFGFVSMVDTDYSINHSYANITLINQGVSGDKTEELLARINQDVIELNPDVVILLIGIKFTWQIIPFNSLTKPLASSKLSLLSFAKAYSKDILLLVSFM